MIPEERTAAELATMSRDDVLAYIEAGGSLADVVRAATPVPATAGPVRIDVPTADDPAVPMVVKAFRLPVAMVAELEALAGNDKAGMSGLVRVAIANLLVRATTNHEVAA